MLRVHVWYHKDGDHVAIVEAPWWSNIYEWLTDRICPCCGVSGWIFEHLGNKEENTKFQSWWYSSYTETFHWMSKKQEELLVLPVEAGCVAAKAIFKKDEPCWKDGCEHCWHLQEDAFDGKGDDDVVR